MNREQLEARIAAEKGPRKRKDLFVELQARGRGEPTREVAEAAAKLSREQLEQGIANEKDVERRQQLFRLLLARKN